MTKNNDIYKMYEEEFYKVEKLNKIINNQKLEIDTLKYELKYSKERAITEVNKATKSYKEENIKLKEELKNALKEIDRLKLELISKKESNDKNYVIDKLTNRINKNSTNSSIPTSKEIRKEKTGVNLYNHREKTNRKPGGQLNHKAKTVIKEQLEQKIKANKIRVVEIKHYIKSNSKRKNKIKYSIGISMKTIIEKHIFIYGKNY